MYIGHTQWPGAWPPPTQISLPAELVVLDARTADTVRHIFIRPLYLRVGVAHYTVAQSLYTVVQALDDLLKSMLALTGRSVRKISPKASWWEIVPRSTFDDY